MLSVVMLKVIQPSDVMLNVVQLSVVMLNVVKLSVIMLNVIMMNVVPPLTALIIERQSTKWRVDKMF